MKVRIGGAVFVVLRYRSACRSLARVFRHVVEAIVDSSDLP